jgi:lipoprotein NlpI
MPARWLLPAGCVLLACGLISPAPSRADDPPPIETQSSVTPSSGIAPSGMTSGVIPAGIQKDYGICLAAYEDEDWARTIAACSHVLEIGAAETGAAQVEALMRRCWALKETDLTDAALRDCNEALRIAPDNATAYNVRGTLFKKMMLPRRAIADYDQALGRDPNFAVAYNNRGNAHDELGEYDRALADYDMALRLDPESAIAHNNRGSTHVNTGNHDAALADYNKALRLDPYFAIAYNNRGNLYFHLGSFTRAARDFEQAINRGIPRDYPLLWLYLARERGGHNGARALETHRPLPAPEIWPGPLYAYFQGRLDADAIRRMIAQGDPRQVARRLCAYDFFIGEAHLLAGRKPAARDLLQRALRDCMPNAVEYDGAKAELARLAP